MRTKRLKGWVVSILIVCAGALPALAETESFTTAREWTHQMSPREKFMSLLPPAFLFETYDVKLRHTLPQYIHWIDDILASNPQLEDEELGNIFASTIFLYEPENRDALRTMETDFLRGDYERTSYEVPRLDIRQALEGDPASE